MRRSAIGPRCVKMWRAFRPTSVWLQTGHEVASIKDMEVAAQEARVDLARAKVRKAELDLGYTRILAPAKGM